MPLCHLKAEKFQSWQCHWNVFIYVEFILNKVTEAIN